MSIRTDKETAAKCLALAGVTAPTKTRKYRNQPVTVDGIRYDSKKEARHGQRLAAMERDGLIFELRRQVRFPIKVGGVLICTYVADFEFRDSERRRVVQDVKGVRTDVYKLKKKLMLAVHGIEVIEV